MVPLTRTVHEKCIVPVKQENMLTITFQAVTQQWDSRTCRIWNDFWRQTFLSHEILSLTSFIPQVRVPLHPPTLGTAGYCTSIIQRPSQWFSWNYLLQSSKRE